MNRAFLLVLFCLYLTNPLCSANMSKPIVHYQIEAELIPAERAVKGKETLTWLNDSNMLVSELQFHLYLNAFKNNRTTFMREGRGAHRGFKLNQKNWGFINIEKLKIEEGLDLTSSMEFIQPDDGNKYDQTVIRVPLPLPIPPQSEITLHIEFYSKLPKVFARAGFADDFFMVAQWFPKIGVLENGKWNCHQYHQNTEFFADYGEYEVHITVPEDYIVGASGKRTGTVENGHGKITYIHYQEDIHDFAWAACPDFVEFREKFFMADPPVDTEIILLVHRSHLGQKDRYLSSLKNGIEFYSQNYGAYPYPTITLVDPPLRASGAGGMEYPTLFTSMTASFLPRGIYLPEMVTIHEFGHNYWYGMVGSNEFEEAWLDEGINSYSEIKAMAQYYGEDSSMINKWGLKISDFVLSRAQLMPTSRLDPVLKKSWEYYSGGSYAVNTYQKAALMLLTLENYLGQEIMTEVMRTYFERWKFRHPSSEDFVSVAEDVSGQNLDWFFDQFLASPDKLDYAVGKVKSEKIKKPEGIFDREKEEEKEGDLYRNEVVVVRKGELIFPQEILLAFENGDKIWENWDGQARWKRFVYIKPYRIEKAHIDPERKVVLDVNFTNNSRLRKPKKLPVLKYALSVMTKFQNILAFFSF